MITQTEVERAILEVEKHNPVLRHGDHAQALVSCEQLRVLLAAAKLARFSEIGPCFDRPWSASEKALRGGGEFVD